MLWEINRTVAGTKYGIYGHYLLILTLVLNLHDLQSHSLLPCEILMLDFLLWLWNKYGNSSVKAQLWANVCQKEMLASAREYLSVDILVLMIRSWCPLCWLKA